MAEFTYKTISKNKIKMYRDGKFLTELSRWSPDREDWTSTVYQTTESLDCLQKFLEARYSRRYINVYCVTRQYGGPEEGGWWYNWRAYVKGYKFDTAKEAEESLEELSDLWHEGDTGNIYSVLGGEEYNVILEEYYAQSKTRYRPHYE